MPINLSVCPNCNNKALKLLIILLLSPVFFFGQTLTGLWTGSISNDSTTVRKDQSFEIALTEYRGKVYGYSRSEFIVDDVLFYVMKRVKGTIDGDVCEVVDDEIISYNFPTKLDKGVKVTSTFRKNKADKVWQLEGTWKTNTTKKYYAVTGKVDLEQEKDLTASKIFPHLEELKLAKDIAFYKEREEGVPIVKIAKPEKIKTSYKEFDIDITQHTGTTAAVNKPIIIQTVSVSEELPSVTKTSEELPKTKTNDSSNNSTAVKPSMPNTQPQLSLATTPKQADESIIAKTNNDKKETISALQEKAIAKKEVPVEKTTNTIVKNAAIKGNEQPKQNATPTTTQPVETKKEVKTIPVEKTLVKKEVVPQNKTGVINVENKTTKNLTKPSEIEKQETKPLTANTPVTAPKKTIEQITYSAAVILGRKSAFTQEVNYESDSLVLTLYDNGEIDGDTVSVFLNGEVIMAKQGLKASAIKKTIYISPDNEDFSLVLFAENLGKYPPNTGLLVVRDGDEVYNLRFSSDFQKNSGIVFRRKKK
ncbi:MAG: hypothetical protein ABIP79_00585 [Chitinophagaceae bacterium]